jgi:hypothetical protein
MHTLAKAAFAPIFLFFALKAAAADSANFYEDSELLYERAWLATDRDVYIAGDRVEVSLATICGVFQLPVQFSSVVYVELYTQAQDPVAQAKANLTDGRGRLSIDIPKKIATDIYYLRAYTNYQKNFGENSFYTKKLRIINPFQVVPHSATKHESTLPADTLFSLGICPSGIMLVSQKAFAPQTLAQVYCNSIEAGSYLLPETDSTSIFPLGGCAGRITVTLSSNGEAIWAGHLAYPAYKAAINIEELSASSEVSLPDVPARSFIASIGGFHSGHRSFGCTYIETAGSAWPAEIVYSPELTGDMLFGNIEAGGGTTPSYILLASPGNASGLMPAPVSSSGKFSIEMPAAGTEYIAVLPDTSRMLSIQIEPEFYPVFPKHEQLSYVPEPWLGSFIKQQMAKVQLIDAFDKKAAPAANTAATYFFGNPTESVEVASFIEMPTLKEYIHELMPSVYVRKRKGRTFFRVSDHDGRGFVGDNPLVLIDGIPYYHHENLLAIPPREIKRLLSYNRRVFFAGLWFDGVFAIESKDSYWELIELPQGAASISFVPAYLPGLPADNASGVSHLLHWNPFAESAWPHIIEHGIEEGKHLLRLQGLANGQVIDMTKEIEIR